MATKVLNTSTLGDHFLPATGWVGQFSADGNPCSIPLGFKPAYVKVINETDTIVWERIGGMQAANSIKNGAADATSAIQFIDGGAGNWSLLLSAALCVTGKSILVYAVG